VGIASPIGIGANAFWDAFGTGECGIRDIHSFDAGGFPCRIGGEVPPFKITDYLPSSYRKAAKVMARDTHLAVIAAHHAFDSAGLTSRANDTSKPDDATFSCHIGAGLISVDIGELTAAMIPSSRGHELDVVQWGAGGMEHLTPLWLLKYLPNMVASHLTIIHGLTGPSNTITASEAGGHLAIGEAFRTIQRGDAVRALCGGAESKVNPLSLARQSLLNRLNTTANDVPAMAVRPFAEDAQGSAVGEGAALLILEELGAACERGAPILAEICGFGASQEPYSLGQTRKTLSVYRTAVVNALREANVEAGDVNTVIPCGTGCLSEDRAEAAELEAVFGQSLDDLPLMLVRPRVGNLFAGNAIDVAAAVLAIRDAALAQTNIDHARAYLPSSTERHANSADADIVLCSTHSVTGQNAALVVRRFYEPQSSRL
jgi:3-oxoacyl-[acyl-carrier-protein] synthase II